MKKHIGSFILTLIMIFSIFTQNVLAFTGTSPSAPSGSSGSGKNSAPSYFWYWSTDREVLDGIANRGLVFEDKTKGSKMDFGAAGYTRIVSAVGVLTAAGYGGKSHSGPACTGVTTPGKMEKNWISWILDFTLNNSGWWSGLAAPKTENGAAYYEPCISNCRWVNGHIWDNGEYKVCFPNQYTTAGTGMTKGGQSSFQSTKANLLPLVTLPSTIVSIANKDGFYLTLGKTKFTNSSGKILSIVGDFESWVPKTEINDGKGVDWFYIPVLVNYEGPTPVTVTNSTCGQDKVCLTSKEGKTINYSDLANMDDDTWDLIVNGDEVILQGSYTSKEGEKEFSHNYKYDIYAVQKVYTYETNSKGEIRNEKIKYNTKKIDTYKFNASWHYVSNIQDFIKVYNPYDLNTESVVSGYNFGSVNGHSLASNVKGDLLMTIDSELNPKQATKPALDNNDKVSFSVNYANNQFGIPTAAQGGFDLQNNYINNNVLGAQYYEPKVYISMNGWDNNAATGVNTQTSLQKGNEAEFNKEQIYYNIQNFSKRWNFRSVQTGEYALGSSINPGYWTLRYKVNQLYEYGAKYEFKITVKTSTTGYTQSFEKFDVVPNPNNGKVNVRNENLYRDHWIIYQDQPLLRGKFTVKTVGGYNP